ncbi:FUSC family protein [Micromonospora sonneratiae]|uniref:Aromatic acid exporter family protein n=1 Tax=Micromonospora sonneratiae TaxID=1184706 RepID=A0ABW3YGW7_9ACTN
MAARRDKSVKLHIDGVQLDTDAHRISEALAELRRKSVPTLHDRIYRVRLSLGLAVQAAIAAALAWVAAHELLGNPEPVFAPIAAVGTLASSLGQRLRRTVELIVGVALGIAIGDGLLIAIGTGPWQLGLIVGMSIIISIALGGGPAVVTQAAATGVLIATLSPTVRNLEFPRVIDALVGGIVGLLVVAVLWPSNPLRLVDKAARRALDILTKQLSVTSDALANGDAKQAQHALDCLQEVEERMDELQDALEGGRETAILSPVRWHRRGALARYSQSIEFINHAVHNSGTLVRRAVTALEDEEPVPPTMPMAVANLAETVRRLVQELGRGEKPEATREVALRAVSEAGRAYNDGVGFSGSVVVAQIRTTASDLLRATGLERTEANHLVRQAIGSASKATAETAPHTHIEDE